MANGQSLYSNGGEYDMVDVDTMPTAGGLVRTECKNASRSIVLHRVDDWYN